MNHIYRVLTFFLCFMVFNSWANTPTIDEALFTTCADRTASNTDHCNRDLSYGGFLLFQNLSSHYSLVDGRFQEFEDGTASFTGQWINIERNDIVFDIDIRFSGRTIVPPNEPKEHTCLESNTDNFYYYPVTSGFFRGRDRVAGSVFEVSRAGEAFQVGLGANVTNNELSFGGSGWLVIEMLSNTNTGFDLELRTNSVGSNGDININLDGNPAVCFETSIALDCPSDIDAVAEFGSTGRVVTWDVPVATTNCLVGGAAICAATNIRNFDFIGEFNGSRYFRSERADFVWEDARDIALAAGGHLAVVCSAEENEFIRSGLRTDDAWIGYTDFRSEGNFVWVNGEDCTYTNWRAGEPNNSGDNEDFTRLLQESGEWTDRNDRFEAAFIMEIPCENSTETGGVVLTQTAGPEPGSIFPIGTTRVTYEAVDDCDNIETCSFVVIVEEAIDPCGGDRAPIVEVESIDPDCGEDNGKFVFTFGDVSGRTNIEFSLDGGQTFPMNVFDNVGMAMFSDLAPGTFELAVRWGNDQCPVDLGAFTLADVSQAAGTECNDNDASTMNDVILADGCSCDGTPVGAISLDCEDDISVVAGPGEEGVLVIFEEPTASTTCGLNGLEVTQIEGLENGSIFPIGTTVVKYQVTDACGNMEMCLFEVVVEETPLTLAIDCVENIEVTAEVGDNGAIVTFNDPAILSNCSVTGSTVSITEGLESGSLFPVGTTTVTFEVEDACGQVEECSIVVTVNPAPTGDIIFDCNNDIELTAAVGANSVVVTYSTPTAQTTCSLDGLSVVRTEGPASGSTFPVGTTTITFTATDACGEEEICTFDVTINPAPTGDIIFDCNNDIELTAAVGANSAVVTYTDPTAQTTCSLDGLSVVRIAGPTSGSTFPVGTTTITFIASDACGEEETCTFDVTVNPAPTGDIIFDCNDDITIATAPGANSAVVTYSTPTAQTTCSLDGLSVVRIAGPTSGSTFPVGTTTITFIASDACGEEETCTFDVTVTPTDLPTGSIGDLVFLDEDQDGIQDAGEIGIGNVTVKLLDAAGNILATDITENNGAYSFSGVEAGDYIIMVNTPDGLEVSPTDEGNNEAADSDILPNGMTALISLAPGEDLDDVDAGLFVPQAPTGSIGDLVFLDEDQDGIQDAGEIGVGNVTVKLLDAAGNILATDITQNNGTYLFSEVEAGDYIIMVNTPDGLEVSPTDEGNNEAADSDILPNGMTALISLAPGEDIDDVDAGLFIPQAPTGSIGDLVFLDEDRDGIQDAGENGIGNVTVKLLDAAGNILATDITENNGAYLFSGVEAGDYIIMINTPDGLEVSPANAGNNEAADSDILPNGMTALISLAPGEDIENVDAGLAAPVVVELVKVGDIVFLDSNGNGLQDSNESGISNVLVFLIDGNGQQQAFTTTDENGMYMFNDLLPGDYQLRFVGQPNNLIITEQDAGNNDEIDSDINSQGLTEVFTLVAGFDDSRDAGFRPRDIQPDPARIGNLVFLDANENGIFDSGEAGIDGVQVKLLSITGDLLQTTATANNGSYSFSVEAGEYIVMFGTPSGFDATTQSGNAADGIDNDSDNNPATGMTGVITVAAGDANPTIDAGFVEESVVIVPGDGPVSCNEVTASVEDGKVIVEGLNGTNAKVEIIGAGTSWAPVLLCGDDGEACGTMTMIDDLPEGDYTVKAQLWGADGSYCYTERNVTVEAGNVPTCDVNGGTIATTDDITDLCVNDGAPSIVNFTVAGGIGPNRAWIVTEEDGTIINPAAPSSVNFEGAGPGICRVYYIRYENVEGLVAGANIDGLTGCFDLSNRISVSRIEDCDTGGAPQCDVNGGTIATTDDITDLCVNDGAPSIVDFTVAGGSGANSAWVVTDADGTIINPDAPSSVDFEGAGPGTCNVYYVSYENVAGLVAGGNIDGLTGCFDLSNRISVSRIEDCDAGGEPQCEEVLVTTGNETITLDGLSAPFAVVKVHDTNAGWTVVDQCFGCDDLTTFNVPEGDYNVVIEFYRGVWVDSYCRIDVAVEVSNGGGPVVIDSDRDGIPAEDDCNDNDDSVGARQAPGTECNDNNPDTSNDIIQADGCTCAGEEVVIIREVCEERNVFNTDNCQFNIIYGLFLKLDGFDEYYGVQDASFVEFTDGTALFTATAINNTSPNIGWEIEVEFGGRTTLAEVAPKQHNCLNVDVNEFYFYETLTGRLTGINDAAGASMSIDRIGPAFQLGAGANITHNGFDFGGSGWFVADMLTQPTNGLEFILNQGAQGQNGDININLSGDATACIEGRDNSELDCGNVSVVVSDGEITINGLTAPIEIVKVFNSNFVPISDCTGDCGESITVEAAPGSYIVRVNFYTANWVGECEVDIPVIVPASAGSASSRNAPQLNMHTFESNREVTVEWLTNTGYKNDAYVIEKSTDGTTFQALNEVTNKDNSDDLAYYKGVDAQPVLGANYYRVKQIYTDGSFDYTDVQLVNFDIDLQSLAVFPNPAREELFVSLKAHAGQTANLQIINTYGQVVRQLAIDEIPAEAIRLDLGDVQNGLYHLSIQVDNSNVISKKVLVSRLY